MSFHIRCSRPGELGLGVLSPAVPFWVSSELALSLNAPCLVLPLDEGMAISRSPYTIPNAAVVSMFLSFIVGSFRANQRYAISSLFSGLWNAKSSPGWPKKAARRFFDV